MTCSPRCVRPSQCSGVWNGGLRSRDLLEFTTVDAARSCGLEARVGSITPGKDADIILLRTDDLTVFPVTDPAATIVSAGHPGLVDTVLVAGRVVKRDGALVGADLPALRARLLASRNRIAEAAGIPRDGTWRPRPEAKQERTGGMSYDALQARNSPGPGDRHHPRGPVA
ncbi:amidohydrolase family protein [Streptomyces hokutonensis]|uniref:amidohydrolase family protein n=1 Tax=Streptomyces hokutonensis TaxID=1306990 RepID=UPI00368299BA